MRTKQFKREDLADYLQIPFLASLFYEFRQPSRIKELRLAKHRDFATETLARVNGELFFKRFRLPSLTHEEQTVATAIIYSYEPFLDAGFFRPEPQRARVHERRASPFPHRPQDSARHYNVTR